jgi:hypothetical protein
MKEKEIGAWEWGKYEQVVEWGKKRAANKPKMCKIFCYKYTCVVKHIVLLNTYFVPKYFTQFWLIYCTNW